MVQRYIKCCTKICGLLLVFICSGAYAENDLDKARCDYLFVYAQYAVNSAESNTKSFDQIFAEELEAQVVQFKRDGDFEMEFHLNFVEKLNEARKAGLKQFKLVQFAGPWDSVPVLEGRDLFVLPRSAQDEAIANWRFYLNGRISRWMIGMFDYLDMARRTYVLTETVQTPDGHEVKRTYNKAADQWNVPDKDLPYEFPRRYELVIDLQVEGLENESDTRFYNRFVSMPTVPDKAPRHIHREEVEQIVVQKERDGLFEMQFYLTFLAKLNEARKAGLSEFRVIQFREKGDEMPAFTEDELFVYPKDAKDYATANFRFLINGRASRWAEGMADNLSIAKYRYQMREIVQTPEGEKARVYSILRRAWSSPELPAEYPRRLELMIQIKDHDKSDNEFYSSFLPQPAGQEHKTAEQIHQEEVEGVVVQRERDGDFDIQFYSPLLQKIVMARQAGHEEFKVIQYSDDGSFPAYNEKDLFMFPRQGAANLAIANWRMMVNGRLSRWSHGLFDYLLAGGYRHEFREIYQTFHGDVVRTYNPYKKSWNFNPAQFELGNPEIPRRYEIVISFKPQAVPGPVSGCGADTQ